MTNTLNSSRIRIQNALVESIASHEFPHVVYDKSTGLASYSGKKYRTIPICNETSGQLDLDRNFGRDYRQRVKGWQMSLICKFQVEVSLDELVDKFIKPLTIYQEGDLPGALVFLRQFTVDHPVQQQGENGTRMVLVFDIVPS